MTATTARAITGTLPRNPTPSDPRAHALRCLMMQYLDLPLTSEQRATGRGLAQALAAEANELGMAFEDYAHMVVQPYCRDYDAPNLAVTILMLAMSDATP